MKKLALDLDTLSVDTFETAAPARGAGTVVAHAPTNGSACTQNAGCYSVECQTPMCITYDPVECGG